MRKIGLAVRIASGVAMFLALLVVLALIIPEGYRAAYACGIVLVLLLMLAFDL